MSKFRLTGIVLGMLVLGIIFASCGGGEKTEEAPTGIAFVTDYDSALTQAQAKNQNIIIDFYTDWCKWCKILDDSTYTDPTVIAMDDNMVFAKINAEVDTATAKKYAVNGYPTIVLTKSDGTEIDRIAGYLPPEEFKTEIENYLKGIGTLDYYLGVADTMETPGIFMKIADKYSERGKYEDAATYYGKIVKMDPKNDSGYTIDARMQLANIDRWTDKYDAAITAYQKIMKDYKGDSVVPDAEIRLAVAYRDKGDTAQAIKAFEGFVKHHPDSPDTSYALSQVDKLKNPPPPDSTKM